MLSDRDYKNRYQEMLRLTMKNKTNLHHADTAKPVIKDFTKKSIITDFLFKQDKVFKQKYVATLQAKMNIGNKKDNSSNEIEQGVMPQVEDSRSQGEKLNDKVLQQQICSTNCKNLINDPAESNVLFNMLNDDTDLLQFFNDHFPEIKAKYAVQKNIKAVFVIQALDKMYRIKLKSNDVSEPLQTNEFYSVFPKREILEALYAKLDEEYRREQQGDLSVDAESVADSMDRIEAMIHIVDEAQKHNLTPEELQMISEMGLPPAIPDDSDISSIVSALSSFDVQNLQQVSDIVLNSDEASPPSGTSQQDLQEPQDPINHDSSSYMNELLQISDDELMKQYEVLLIAHDSAEQENNMSLSNDIEMKMAQYDEAMSFRIRGFLTEFDTIELINQYNGALDEYTHLIDTNPDDRYTIHLLKLNLDGMKNELDSRNDGEPSDVVEESYEVAKPHVKNSLNLSALQEQELFDLGFDPNEPLDTEGINAFVDWDDIDEFTSNLIDELLDFVVSKKDESIIETSIQKLDALLDTTHNQQELNALVNLSELSGIMTSNLSEHNKVKAVEVVLKSVTANILQEVADRTRTEIFDPIIEEISMNPLTSPLVTTKEVDGVVYVSCPIGSFKLGKKNAIDYFEKDSNDYRLLYYQTYKKFKQHPAGPRGEELNTKQIAWAKMLPQTLVEFNKFIISQIQLFNEDKRGTINLMSKNRSEKAVVQTEAPAVYQKSRLDDVVQHQNEEAGATALVSGHGFVKQSKKSSKSNIINNIMKQLHNR